MLFRPSRPALDFLAQDGFGDRVEKLGDSLIAKMGQVAVVDEDLPRPGKPKGEIEDLHPIAGANT